MSHHRLGRCISERGGRLLKLVHARLTTNNVGRLVKYHTSRRLLDTATKEAPKDASAALQGRPFNELVVSAVKEIYKGERRVALTPTATSNLVKKGVTVRIEEGAGALAQFNDEEFHKAGANVVSRKEAFQADVVLKVRVPQESEAELFRPKSTLISVVQPAINKQIMDLLAQRQLTVFAMDCIPRISRAQVRNLPIVLYLSHCRPIGG